MLIDGTDLAVFVGAALTLNLTPGNDMMFVLGQSLRSGPRTGIAASLGIATGSAVHLVLVMLGVAAVLSRHPVLFDMIRYAGAAYLLWIAWKAITSVTTLVAPAGPRRTALEAWRDGALVNLLNPKTIVFMFAFLPPFVHPENGHPILQILILGAIFNLGGTLINVAVAVMSGRISAQLNDNSKMSRWFARISALLYLLLAARLASSAR